MRQILILLAVCISGALSAQSTSLAGKITDRETGEELIGGNVTLYLNGVLATGAATDFTGNYSINVDPGTYDVEVSYIGYSPQRVTGVTIRSGQANRLDLQLGSGGGRIYTTYLPANYFQMKYEPLSIEEEENLSREELFNEAECDKSR